MENLSRKGAFIKFTMSLMVSFLFIVSASCTGPLEFNLPSPAPETSDELTFREAFDRLSNVSDRARNAAVKVVNIGDGFSAQGSGTMFKVDGQFIVITAAHVVQDAESVIITTPEGLGYFGTPLMANHELDYAILLVPEIAGRTPLRLRTLQEHQFRVGAHVTYTGFPNGHNLLSISGELSGTARGNHLIMHSYAWPGSSGSCVFDNQGRLVGVLRAVDVGTAILPQIIEDIVWIVPAWRLDYDALHVLLQQ
jgi:S1-C subfamily serine protease|tara:strand:- start:1155 stop:1910 length:756 start_codon:yes stop_codon:yes gene_type:complete